MRLSNTSRIMKIKGLGSGERALDSETEERLPFVWKTRKLRGEFKWDCSSRGKFSWKKVIPFEILPFSRFYWNDRNLWYHLFGLPVPGFKSRESEKIYGYFVNGTTQFRSCFRCQKKYEYHLTKLFHQNFLKVLLRSNLGICFWLHISKMYVKVTYRAKFGVQIWSGSVFICTAIFVNVLPPLLDSKNDRE